MVGIELGASRITLSMGEHIELAHRDGMSDLLVRIGDDRPIVRVPGSTTDARTPEIEDAAQWYAESLASVLRTDNLAGRQLSLQTQLSLAQDIVLAVPGWWSLDARARFDSALQARGLVVTTVNGAEAAVAGAQIGGSSLPSDVAVIDARSGFTSVSIVRECATRPRALYSPSLVHREGGDALDAAVLRHLIRGLEGVGDVIDRNSSSTISAGREALLDIRQLRETLSFRATAALRPELPGAAHRIILSRSEVDEIATPWADEVVGMVRTAIEESPIDVPAVLITGGLASMPLLTQRISADLGLEVHVPDDRSTVVARGAEVISSQVRAPSRGWLGWRGLRKPREHAMRQGAVR